MITFNNIGTGFGPRGNLDGPGEGHGAGGDGRHALQRDAQLLVGPDHQHLPRSVGRLYIAYCIII